MTSALLVHLAREGHLTRVARLRSLGYSGREIDRAVGAGHLVRVARGWVATGSASRPAVTAVLRGGKLTSATALASGSIWSGIDRRIHVALPPHSTGSNRARGPAAELFPATKYVGSKVVLHWDREKFPVADSPSWRVSIVDALVRVAHDASAEHFIASVDSAINKKALARAAIPTLFALLPHRLSRLADDIDGRAESGIETLPRLRLRPVVGRLEIQVRIPGIARLGGAGRVDLLIDGWLVIEADGDEFHDAALDRERNAALIRLGYRVHRFGYDQIVNRWHEVEATILELLRYPPIGKGGRSSHMS